MNVLFFCRAKIQETMRVEITIFLHVYRRGTVLDTCDELFEYFSNRIRLQSDYSQKSIISRVLTCRVLVVLFFRCVLFLSCSAGEQLRPPLSLKDAPVGNCLRQVYLRFSSRWVVGCWWRVSSSQGARCFDNSIPFLFIFRSFF